MEHICRLWLIQSIIHCECMQASIEASIYVRFGYVCGHVSKHECTYVWVRRPAPLQKMWQRPLLSQYLPPSPFSPSYHHRHLLLSLFSALLAFICLPSYSPLMLSALFILLVLLQPLLAGPADQTLNPNFRKLNCLFLLVRWEIV